MTGIQALQCPQCGGTLELGMGSHVATCRYCEQSSLITGGDGVLRFVIEPELSRERLRGEAKRQVLDHPRIDPSVRNRARLRSESYWFVPFLYLSGRRIGGVIAHEQVRLINGFYERLLPGCRLETPVMDRIELNMRQLKAEGTTLLPFNLESMQELGVVYDLDRPLEELKEEACEAPKLATGEARVMEPRFKLIYTPIYVADYAHEGELVSITLDARTGKVLYARMPERKTLRLPIVLSVVGVTGLILGNLARLTVHLAQTADGSMFVAAEILLVLTVVFGGLICFLLSIAWDVLRFPRELVFEKGAIRVVQATRPAETWFGKLAATYFGALSKLLDGMAGSQKLNW